MTKPRVLILGHSFVRRLQTFMSRSTIDQKLSLSDTADVRLYGVGGRTVSKVLEFDLGVVDSFKPDVVILQLGSNDLVDLAPETVGSSLEELVHLLHTKFAVKLIGVCQTLKRVPPSLRVPDFNTRVVKLSTYLKVVLEPLDFCFYWKHIGFWRSQSTLFLPDGVHLNELGSLRYYRSLRGAELRSISLLQ